MIDDEFSAKLVLPAHEIADRIKEIGKIGPVAELIADFAENQPPVPKLIPIDGVEGTTFIPQPR